MTFQIHPLPKRLFESLFTMSDADLLTRNIRKITADADPGYPCRISLQDAKVGDALLLLNYHHLVGDTPYAASHAIFVRQNATEARVDAGAVPESLARRLLSVRGYDAQRQMVDADVVEGQYLATALEKLFANGSIDFVHIHHAKQGCFAAMATRS